MKLTRHKGNDTRRVLAAMATDRTVAARIASRWRDGGLFDSPWANLIGGWCVDHVRKYGQPPGGSLRDLFEKWAEGRRDRDGDETIAGVEKFLSYVSDEWASQDPPSSDYLLDLAGRVFNKSKLRRTLEEATDELDAGRVEETYAKLTGTTRVELGAGSLVKPAEDFEAWSRAFDAEHEKPLLSYNGALDTFLAEAMVREALIAIMAPDKTAKSFWLLDVAFRIVRDRHRVAYFEAGDLGEAEVMRRLGERSARKPRRPGGYEVPTGWEEDGGKLLFRAKTSDGPLTKAEGFDAFRKICRGRDRFRLSCHANSSINVAGIGSILRDWEREEWTPDAVVVDYADILAPPSGVRDTLDQIDDMWRHLRRLSQENRCLVVTASQSSALAYKGKQKVLKRMHFSGRKTKLAHVNGMIGLNVTPEEKDKGITRVNWVVRRDRPYNENQCVTVAGCLAIASPAIRSRW